MKLLSAVLFYDSHLAKLIRRPFWNTLYTRIGHDFLPANAMAFLNFGYLTSPGEPGSKDRDDIADYVSGRLYDQVVGDADLTGRIVAEVGCGPGAGSAHLARSCSPASFVGVDLNKDMITWCRKHHDVPGLEFLQGDALNLPITSNSLDAVINVESSHCYPSRLRFFQEVVRVLRPGGLFLFADVILCLGKKQGPDAVSAYLKTAGLVIDHCIDITENVLAARDAVSDSPLFRSRLPDSIAFLKRPLIEEGLCLTGTNFYKQMAAGRLRYMQWRAFKPNGIPSF